MQPAAPGEVAEWLKAAVLKTAERKFRGFESHSLRPANMASPCNVMEAGGWSPGLCHANRSVDIQDPRRESGMLTGVPDMHVLAAAMARGEVMEALHARVVETRRCDAA